MKSTNPRITTTLPSGFMRLITCGVALLTASTSQMPATELRAAISGCDLVLSWTHDLTNDFYLEVSTNLTDTAGWCPATNEMSLAGNDCITSTPIHGEQRFFRLKAWEVLFDGTSTAAFRGYRQSGFPSNDWVMTNESELKTVSGRPQGYIITTNQYGDFELLWEWKTSVGGNGGVLYRASEYYDQPHRSAPEYQLIDDSGYTLPMNQQIGAVYGLIAPTNKVAVNVGHWNQCRLVVQNNHVEHWLNGRRIVQYDLNSAAFSALVAGSQFGPYISQFGKAQKGHLAFQNWTPEIWYRKIKVRSLSSSGGS